MKKHKKVASHGAEKLRDNYPQQLSKYDDETVSEQLHIFLDEWYARILNSSAGKHMSRWQALASFLDVLEIVGACFAAGEKETIARQDSDEAAVAAIVARFPLALRERWESIALQLQEVVDAATRLRTVADAQDIDVPDAVAQIFEDINDADALHQVLKGAIMFSARDAARLRQIHRTWRENTEARIDRMARYQGEAERTAQELLKLEAQLSELGSNQKCNAKSVLLHMAGGQDEAMKHSVFGSWRAYLLKAKDEKATRRRLEDRIAIAETKFVEFKASQLETVGGIMRRMCNEDADALVREMLGIWKAEVRRRKEEDEHDSRLRQAQSKIDQFDARAIDTAKQVMIRLAEGSKDVMLQLCLKAWFDTGHAERKERALQDAVSKTEAAIKKRLFEAKNETREILAKMTGGGGRDMLALAMQLWRDFWKEETAMRAMSDAVQTQEQKFRRHANTQRRGNLLVQMRINQKVDISIVQRVFADWLLETKVNGINHVFNQKYNCKKRQLQGVQNLFKSFATQLDQNLGVDDLDDDEGLPAYLSGRGPPQPALPPADRVARSSAAPSGQPSGKRKHKGIVRDNAGAASLPDIHSRSSRSLLS